MTSLEEIKRPIQQELKEFESRFRESTKSRVALLDRITYYIVQRKGKQMRPMFVFLCAKLFGSIKEETYIGASLIELLHTATLVHDDVVDDSHLRRGFFSINALWKNKIAVLVGDFLLSKGLLIAIGNKQFSMLEVVSDAVKDMSEGELLQIEKARKLDITEDVYFDIIQKKTASLISAACAIGALSTGASQDDIFVAKEFGKAAGIAFQIKDDLFDYGFQNIGKPTGIDIKEKKLTLPLIHVMQNLSRKEKNEIRRLIKNKSEKKDAQKKIIALVKEHGGIDSAEKVMLQYKDEALSWLEKLPQNEASESLRALVNFVVNRSH